MQGEAKRNRDIEPRFGRRSLARQSGVPARARKGSLGWNDEDG